MPRLLYFIFPWGANRLRKEYDAYNNEGKYSRQTYRTRKRITLLQAKATQLKIVE